MRIVLLVKINGEHKEMIDLLEKKIDKLENKKSDEIIVEKQLLLTLLEQSLKPQGNS